MVSGGRLATSVSSPNMEDGSCGAGDGDEEHSVARSTEEPMGVELRRRRRSRAEDEERAIAAAAARGRGTSFWFCVLGAAVHTRRMLGFSSVWACELWACGLPACASCFSSEHRVSPGLMFAAEGLTFNQSETVNPCSKCSELLRGLE